MIYFRALALCVVIDWASGNRWDEGIDGILQGEGVGPTETPCPAPNLYPDLAPGTIPVNSAPGASKGRLVGREGRLEYRAPTCTDGASLCVEKCCPEGTSCCYGYQESCCLPGETCIRGSCFAGPSLTSQSIRSTASVRSVQSVASVQSTASVISEASLQSIEQSISQQSLQSVASLSALQSESQASISSMSEASMASLSSMSEVSMASLSHTADPTSDESSTTSESNSPSNTGSSKRSDTGAIIGASVGGATALILIGLAAFFCLRTKKEPAPTFTPSKAPSPPMMQPIHSPPTNVAGYSPYTNGYSGTIPGVTHSMSPSPPMMRPTQSPPANGVGWSPYSSGYSGSMAGVTRPLIYNETTPPNFAPNSGYEVPAWLLQSNDAQGRPFSVSTSPSPPLGTQAYTDLSPPPPSPSLPDYGTQEGGTSSQPSDYKAAYRPVNPQSSLVTSRVVSGGFNAGEGENRSN